MKKINSKSQEDQELREMLTLEANAHLDLLETKITFRRTYLL
jgi:hypothetical protein